MHLLFFRLFRRICAILLGSILLTMTGCVQTTSVPDNCFPSDATMTGTISGDFFVGFTHKEDPATHKNPSSPTIHSKADVISESDSLNPG